MDHRKMTAEELARFEREQIHHEDETTPDAGPASEADLVNTEAPDPVAPVIPPNPD